MLDWITWSENMEFIWRGCREWRVGANLLICTSGGSLQQFQSSFTLNKSRTPPRHPPSLPPIWTHHITVTSLTSHHIAQHHITTVHHTTSVHYTSPLHHQFGNNHLYHHHDYSTSTTPPHHSTTQIQHGISNLSTVPTPCVNNKNITYF